MARQGGIIKIKGTIGDITFFKTRDGYRVKEKSGVDADRIATDPKFQRTRENGAEFGESALASKILRSAIRAMLKKCADHRMVSRLVKVMSLIKNMDNTSIRGKRNVAAGITQPAAQALLKGFNFNIAASLGSVLFKPYMLVPATGLIQINGLVPLNDLMLPPGSTHAAFTGTWVRVDFATGVSEVFTSPAVNIPLNAVSTNINLMPGGVPAGTGTDLYLLRIEYFQEVNGIQYSLNNGEYTALAIIEVI